MSLQWTLIASFLYSEMTMVFMMMLPFISATRWRKIFKSRFLRSIEAQANIYFYIALGLLVLAFLDSIREMRKYTGEESKEQEHGHLDSQMQIHMKLFRAQRNFYIAGFTLFLFLVIKRMVTLISIQAMLTASNEASMKQAQAATDAANKLLEEKEKNKQNDAEVKDNVGNSELETKEKENMRLMEELQQTKDDLKYAKSDLVSMKSQAKSVSEEYDRLMTEHAKLQNELKAVKGGEDKKDD